MREEYHTSMASAIRIIEQLKKEEKQYIYDWLTRDLQ